jgi:7-cyano-7-deazaguanine reductase
MISNRAARRSLLSASANPTILHDYLSILEGAARNGGAQITIRYVPDKSILPLDAFSRYLAALEDISGEPLESLAAIILDDFNNEIVPRWVQIVAARNDDGQARQGVLIEDRQPNWDNPSLLSHLTTF